ncbi:anoctamin-1-like isoform X3 [Biomphalaria glabrata]|uniref:Anoctamin n=1 Tax=Biomphalaria glabrata TaxID=6526 RepID=A0A2C9K9V8_BIOGL|nr:anoctamin-1-like isoform X3 [Biomphalaria glabrata]
MAAKYTPAPRTGDDSKQKPVRLQTFSGANGLDEEAQRHTDDEGDVDGQTANSTQDKPKLETDLRNLFFDDGKRRIDFILAWTIDHKRPETARQARQVFEENLIKEGLELEYDTRGRDVNFVKVHAPFDVLKRYADILKLRMPMKMILAEQHMKEKYSDWENRTRTSNNNVASKTPLPSVGARLWNNTIQLVRKFMVPFHYDETVLPTVSRSYSCPYSSSREYLFEIPENKDEYFSKAIRSWIVDYILRRQSFNVSNSKTFSFGIKKMLSDGFYSAAYPLHEGHWKAGSANNARKVLFDHWANWTNCLKFQPIDYIRFYFGEKIALYFAWLGFYTLMLVPATVVGLAVFFYGLGIMSTNIASKELCDPHNNITMCPLCDARCPYWKLSDACSHAKASRIFDNGATVFFAIFMSLWGTLFLEFWKRKEATIQYKWDLTTFVQEEEPPRPEYLSKLENWQIFKMNPVTGIQEPHLPFWKRRFPIFLASYSIMLFLAAIAVTAVIGVIAYRVSMLAALQLIPQHVSSNSTVVATTAGLIYENASLVTTVTAALINLAIIIILNVIYGHLAFWLTDWECLRTQSEYDNSITIKLFALQFVNYFCSIFYIAFFKGQFVGRPGKYRTIFGGRQEECEAGGCLIELCIQLAIIMVGKQLIQNNFIEIVVPKLIKLVKRKCSKETREQKLAKTPWEKDYILAPAESMSLFYEYLEMVLQFGFLTIFCAAFPLAPLFALLNNIVEIRVDANKFTTHLRRPLAEKSANIGIWYSVLYGISRIAIISNAFIIALTSEFIPRLVYTSRYSPDESLSGYINFTMAYFNTSDFAPSDRPKDIHLGVISMCRYKDFRNPPWEDPEYRRSTAFWHVLAARLAFVVVFENVVVVITSLISWLIPDVPTILKEQIHREAYITNEIVLKTELRRAQGEDLNSLGGAHLSDENLRYSPHHSEDIELKKRSPSTGKSKSGSQIYI